MQNMLFSPEAKIISCALLGASVAAAIVCAWKMKLEPGLDSGFIFIQFFL